MILNEVDHTNVVNPILVAKGIRSLMGAPLLAEGKVMKEVAGILHMTTRTVAYHKYRIMEVLGATCNAELVKYAVRNHIVAA